MHVSLGADLAIQRTCNERPWMFKAQADGQNSVDCETMCTTGVGGVVANFLQLLLVSRRGLSGSLRVRLCNQS